MQKKLEKLNIELLAPAGDFESLEAAIYFGADAVYFAGKNFGLRQAADNFSNDDIVKAIKLCHSKGVKAYIACNLFAKNSDELGLIKYFKFLATAKPDALIISDPGVLLLAKKYAKKIDIHLSTQSNTTSSMSANFWAKQGVKRIVLARELSLLEIADIRQKLPKTVELEAFGHGAMCVAYSGRCLISSFVSGRPANRGECVQHCRYEYEIREKGYDDKSKFLTLAEDEKGSYILNSKDLNMINHILDMQNAGIVSLKIEGRAKTGYYVGNVVNAYRRAIDFINSAGDSKNIPNELVDELYKSSHREYFTGFYFGDKNNSQYLLASRPKANYQFVAKVLSSDGEFIKAQLRNKIIIGNELQILSPDNNFNQTIKIQEMFDDKNCEKNSPITIANKVKQTIYIKSNIKLSDGDMLRKKL